MSDKKSNNVKVIAVIGALFVVLLAVLFYAMPKTPAPTDTTAAETAATGTPADTAAASQIDVNEALSDRILGDTNAPVQMTEFASLTCSHCGEFHRLTFDQIKTNYIDTGKVYVVFSDFPLNAPAIKATMAARCLPKDKYFDFVHNLFQKQEEWAYDAEYIAYLKKEAGTFGMSEAVFDQCVNNKELEEGIKARIKLAQDKWQIASTPSFVLNNKTTLAGAYPYDAFSKALDEEIAKAEKVNSLMTSPEAEAQTPAAGDAPAENPAVVPLPAPEATPTETSPPVQDADPVPASAGENADESAAPSETEQPE